MAVFAICIFFSATIPLLPVACLIYSFVRHATDACNLITVYRKEINSQLGLTSDVVNTVVVIVMLYQVTMAAYFAVNKRDQESISLVVLLIVSATYVTVFYEPINEEVYEFQHVYDSLIGKKSQQQMEDEIN